MRKLLYRGKRIETGEWVYGDLIQLSADSPYWFIMPNDASGEMYERQPYPFRQNDVMCECAFAKVDPKTIGEFTGRCDKNGTQIFECDLVYYCNSNHDEEDGAMEVKYEDGEFILSDGGLQISLSEIYDWEIEVIGNIHDNPELLEVNHD